MELRKKISDHEIKLLIAFFTLILCVAAYQLGYRRYNQMAGRLETENASMRIQVSELAQKQANMDRKQKDTLQLKSDTEAMLCKFPSRLEQESIIMMINALCGYSGMKLSQIAYDEITVFYSDIKGLGQMNGEGLQNVSGSETVSDFENVTDSGRQLTGYKTSVNLSYQTTYEGLKKGLQYILQHEDRMAIEALTAAFDNTTGNLTGTMTILLYAVDGAGRKAKITDILGVEIGMDNVFGSFEIIGKEANVSEGALGEEEQE